MRHDAVSPETLASAVQDNTLVLVAMPEARGPTVFAGLQRAGVRSATLTWEEANTAQLPVGAAFVWPLRTGDAPDFPAASLLSLLHRMPVVAWLRRGEGAHVARLETLGVWVLADEADPQQLARVAQTAMERRVRQHGRGGHTAATPAGGPSLTSICRDLFAIQHMDAFLRSAAALDPRGQQTPQVLDFTRRRDTLLLGIPQPVQTWYRTLSAQGTAMPVLSHVSAQQCCGACGNPVPTAMLNALHAGPRLAQCPHCLRILCPTSG